MSSTDMSAVSVLIELARQVRATTLHLLEVPDPSWLTWLPSGTSNHILWHAGHACWVCDALSVERITGRSEVPPSWGSIFGQYSQPATVTVWPAVGDVRSQLETQLDRIVTLLAENAEKIANDAKLPPQEGQWPLLPGMIHGWHDEAKHQGEMFLLHKLRRAN